MNKINIAIAMGGAPPREEAFHHFLLLGFDFDGAEAAEGQVALSVVASSSDVGRLYTLILPVTSQ